MGEWSSNELMPSFTAKDKDDQSAAELVDDLFRKAFRKHGGKQALKNAVFEAACGGYGALRVGTRYVDDTNPEDERQELTFTPINGAHSTVVWDGNSQCYDKRDARYCYILWEYTPEAFKEKWPDAECASFTCKDDRRFFNWDTGNKVFVAEAYHKREQRHWCSRCFQLRSLPFRAAILSPQRRMR